MQSNYQQSLQGILIPGGGLDQDNRPTAWTRNRLDRAAEVYKQCGGNLVLMPLSAGTTHKAPPHDDRGFPIYESTAAARYLLERQVAPEHIRFDAYSLDTLGNAAFARWCLTDPDPDLRNLLVITSEFHMPRTQKIFEWVYGLPPAPSGYRLSFETVPDTGLLPEELQARIDKEQQGLARVVQQMQDFTTMQAFQEMLLTVHDAYSTRGLTTEQPRLSAAAQRSY